MCWIKENWPLLFAGVLIGILGVICALVIEGMFFCEYVTGSGTIVAFEFAPGATTTTTGVVINPNGSTSPVIVAGYKPPSYNVIVQPDSSDIVRASSDVALFYTLETGQRVTFAWAFGKWTGIKWGTRIIGVESAESEQTILPEGI